MKKLLCLLLALVMVLSLAACAEKDGDEKEDGDNRENMSWRELMEEGQRLLEEEEYDEAIDVLTDAIDLRDTRSDLYFLRGQAYQGKGSSSALKKAVKDYEAALEITKDYEEAWIGLVETLIAQGEYEKAAERAEEGLDILGSNRKLERLLDQIEDELGGADDGTEPATEPSEEPPEELPTEPVHVHSWLEANYQEPQRCAECGETVGAPLTADFTKYGIRYISASGAVGTPYYYQTCVYEDPDVKTVGILTLTDYLRFDGDGDRYPYEEDFEWIIATFQIQFYDDNAVNHGYNPGIWWSDYYTIAESDDSYYVDNYGNEAYYVHWYDYRVDILYAVDVLQNEWDGDVATVVLQYVASVPRGYDGVVYGFFDYGSLSEDSYYLYEAYNDTFLLYRFD